MEEYRNCALNHGCLSVQALQNETKKWARLEEKNEDFLMMMMMQQTQQLADNNLLLVSSPMFQLDEACFVSPFTSDRSGELLASNVEPALVSLGLNIDMSSRMQQQHDEFDTLIKCQNEKVLKWVLEEWQRHLQDIFASAEQRISTMLMQKDAELEILSCRNIQLQGLAKHLSMEALMWQKVAKDNEDMVGNLKSNLEQLVTQIRDQQICKERFGDVDDALSCCYDPQNH